MEKVCVNHPESPSVGSCKACEKPVCLMCITEVQGVSFCSEACGAAYQEVKDWLERPAAEEEWNPLAEAKAKVAPVAKAPAPAPAPKPAPQAPTGAEMHDALATAFEDKGAAGMTAAPAAAPSGPNRMPLYIAIAATVVVVIGAMMLFSGKEEPVTPPPPPPLIAKVDPPKPEPVKVDPPKPEPAKVEPPKPVVLVVKVEPPKPEPVKVEPPKPEPVKVEPPKPEPAKLEPPKPVVPVVKVEPPKPEPVKVEPPKPEPAKLEPPKPSPAPPPPPKPEPPPAPHLAMVRDPWAKEKTGAWYRLKTSSDGKDSYKDIGLRETGAGYRVIVSQASAGGKTDPEQFIWTEPEEVSVFGSVNGDANGTKYAADVVRTKTSKPSQFVFKEGPHAGAWFAGDATLTTLDEQTVRVKDRDFPCSVLGADLKSGAHAKTWICLKVPVGVIKSESAGTTSAMVDFGEDWEKRPPFPAPPAPVIAKVDPPPVVPVVVVPVPVPVPVVTPEPAKVVPPPPPTKTEPPKPPPPPPPKVDTAKEEASARAKKSMTDASALIKEASPMYGEISSAMDTLPGDKASLRDLYRKAERVQLKLSDARILYSSVRNDVADPAVVDRRVKQLDELLEGVQDAMKTLKGKLE